MAKPDSYMPLYTGNWLRATMGLTAQERDAYMLLCIRYWDNGGPIPNDDAKLARMALCTSEVWETVKVTVKEFFEVTDKDATSNLDGLLKHSKLDLWLEEAHRKYAQAKARSLLANEAKRNKSSRFTSKDTGKVTGKDTSKVTVTETGTVSQPKPNKSKDLGGFAPRAPSGASSPPPSQEELEASKDKADRYFKRGKYAEHSAKMPDPPAFLLRPQPAKHDA